jgi:hypothetical protein
MVDVVIFKYCSPGRNEGSNDKVSVKTVGVLAEIRTGHLPNTSQKGYR